MAGSRYTVAILEEVLPALWDESLHAEPINNPEGRPEPGMPRAQSNPAHSHLWWAVVADIRRAWEEAPLTLKQRRAVFMHYGLRWPTALTGAHLGCHHTNVTRRVERALINMSRWLDGEELESDDTE